MQLERSATYLREIRARRLAQERADSPEEIPVEDPAYRLAWEKRWLENYRTYNVAAKGTEWLATGEFAMLEKAWKNTQRRRRLRYEAEKAAAAADAPAPVEPKRLDDGWDEDRTPAYRTAPEVKQRVDPKPAPASPRFDDGWEDDAAVGYRVAPEVRARPAATVEEPKRFEDGWEEDRKANYRRAPVTVMEVRREAVVPQKRFDDGWEEDDQVDYRAVRRGIQKKNFYYPTVKETDQFSVDEI
mmetsp:Transcript_34171/g.78897  ORF Transcript_34171/g.78897 Transcript_34171/m.78897 type:complete len:243 (-) Transcript_34171:102-830(-)